MPRTTTVLTIKKKQDYFYDILLNHKHIIGTIAPYNNNPNNLKFSSLQHNYENHDVKGLYSFVAEILPKVMEEEGIVDEIRIEFV